MTHCLEPPVSVPDGGGKENVAKQRPPHDQEAEGKGKGKDWGPGIPKDFPPGLTPLEFCFPSQDGRTGDQTFNTGASGKEIHPAQGRPTSL